MAGVKTQVLRDWAAVTQLKGEWNDLLARSRANSLFLTWEWIDAWREVAGASVQPFVVTARGPDGALLGILPLYLTGLRLLGLIRLRALRILGDQQSGSEYGDWMLDAEREDEAGLALAEALSAARGCWDCLWMPNVAGWTGARERIVSSCDRGGLPVRERPIEFSAVELPRDYDDYWRALSSNARSTIQRQAKKVAASGSDFVRCETFELLPTFINALVDLNDGRWRAVGGAGNFKRKPLELAFYRRFAEVALSHGWLRLFALKLGRAFGAVQIGYSYKGSFLQLQEGFDPNGVPGAGNVLRIRVIEACIREGLATYDFLGDHTEHKRRWLANARQGHDLLVTHKSPISSGVRALTVWPTGRYLHLEEFSRRT